MRTVPRLLHNLRHFPSSVFRFERLFFDLIFIVFLCEDEQFFIWDIQRRHLNICCLYVFRDFEPDLLGNFEFQFGEEVSCCIGWTHYLCANKQMTKSSRAQFYFYLEVITWWTHAKTSHWNSKSPNRCASTSITNLWFWLCKNVHQFYNETSKTPNQI